MLSALIETIGALGVLASVAAKISLYGREREVKRGVNRGVNRLNTPRDTRSKQPGH